MSKNHNVNYISSKKYTMAPNTLVSNLSYIRKYITSTLIIKEKMLKLSILGGKYDNTAASK